jgi:hypothetical protein
MTNLSWNWYETLQLSSLANYFPTLQSTLLLANGVPPDEYQKLLTTLYSTLINSQPTSLFAHVSTATIITLSKQFIQTEQLSSSKPTLISILNLLNSIPHPDSQLRSQVFLSPRSLFTHFFRSSIDCNVCASSP